MGHQSPEGSADDFHNLSYSRSIQMTITVSIPPKGPSTISTHRQRPRAGGSVSCVSILRRVRRRFPPQGARCLLPARSRDYVSTPRRVRRRFPPGCLFAMDGTVHYKSQSPEGYADDSHQAPSILMPPTECLKPPKSTPTISTDTNHHDHPISAIVSQSLGEAADDFHLGTVVFTTLNLVMSESPEGPAPDFHEAVHGSLAVGTCQPCLNHPKGPRPISTPWIVVTDDTKVFVSILRMVRRRIPLEARKTSLNPPQERELRRINLVYTGVSIPRRGVNCDIQDGQLFGWLPESQSPAGARTATSLVHGFEPGMFGLNPPQGRELRPPPGGFSLWRTI